MSNKKALNKIMFWILLLCLAIALGIGAYLWKVTQIKEIEKTLGDLKPMGEIEVQPGTTGLKVILSWEGESDLDLVLINPNGAFASPGMPGVFYSEDHFEDASNREKYEILDPIPGKWTIKVYTRHAVGDETFDVNVYQTTQEL